MRLVGMMTDEEQAEAVRKSLEPVPGPIKWAERLTEAMRAAGTTVKEFTKSMDMAAGVMRRASDEVPVVWRKDD